MTIRKTTGVVRYVEERATLAGACIVSEYDVDGWRNEQ